MPYIVTQKNIVIATGGIRMKRRKVLFFSNFTSSNAYTVARDKHILSRNTIPIMNVLSILLNFINVLSNRFK